MYFRPALFAIVICATLSAQQKAVQSAAPPAPKSADESQVYRSSTFGFRYRIPFGWVDRTKDLQDQDEQKQGASQNSDAPKTEVGKGETAKGQVLLAIFERPPQAAGDAVNSAVLMASESAVSYPGLKSAEDYLAPLNEVTASKGFKPDGDPQEITIDGRNLVRADFTKPLNDKLHMYQSTLVLVEKKQIVSFTFIAGSKDEIDELIDALNFQSKGARHK